MTGEILFKDFLGQENKKIVTQKNGAVPLFPLDMLSYEIAVIIFQSNFSFSSLVQCMATEPNVVLSPSHVRNV